MSESKPPTIVQRFFRACLLILGGIVLLYVDQLKLTPKYTDIYEYPPLLCLYIGLFQMLALVPVQLGKGTPFFKDGARRDFDLVETRPLSNGTIILRYAPEGVSL